MLLAFLASGPLWAQAPIADLSSHLVGAWGVDLGDQDRSVRPGDDFYRFQNGGWLARTQLGPTQPMAAYWRDLRLMTPRRLVAILTELAARSDATLDPSETKLAVFYRAFMDEKTVESLGTSPLEPELAAIRHAATRSQLAEVMGRIAGAGTIRGLAAYGRPLGRAPFSIDVGQDPGDPARSALFLSQAGLLLPGPEFYLDAQFADVRSAYEAYAAQILAAIGWPDAKASAHDIVAFETTVAAASWSHEQLLDSVKTYNPLRVSELETLAPGFDWRAFLRGAEAPRVDRLVIDAKGAFPGIAAAYAAAPLATLRARLALAAADSSAPFSSENLAAPQLTFRGQVLGNTFMLGVERSVRAERAAEACLGDLLGVLYVARYSSPEAKALAADMANRLEVAFDARLASTPWMTPAGKALVRAKLAKLSIHIGYPDRFDDYRGLEVRAHDLYGNVTRAAAYDWHRRLAALDKPFDRSAWMLAAEYPNYGFIAATNTIEIPAALLQPPFFDPRADAAVNYGALGAQIGQVILSGFTQQGLAYDGDGRLRAWLPAADAELFASLNARVSARYSTIEPLPGLHLKGELVTDEAVADLGGLLIALDAYHASLAGRPAPILDGTTGDQRFFLGRAQMWRAKFPPASVRNQVATGANAPPFARVIGPLPNIDAWYAAFDVQPRDAMYLAPEDRIRIW